MVEGIGERLTPLPAALQYHLVVVNPGIAVPTAEVYRRFKMEEVQRHPDTCALQEALLQGDVQRIASCYGNVLEPPAFAAYPQVACLKQRCLKFGLPTLMSGSGGSIWILVEQAQAAREVAAVLRKAYPFAAAVHSVAQGILVI